MEYSKVKLELCCKKMNQKAKLLKDETLKDHCVIYDHIWREHAIYFAEDFEQRDRVMCDHIFYCPFCGTKLPTSLADEWFDTLEREYGIEDPSDEDYDRVPLEFRSDAWWKKRGL